MLQILSFIQGYRWKRKASRYLSYREAFLSSLSSLGDNNNQLALYKVISTSKQRELWVVKDHQCFICILIISHFDYKLIEKQETDK